jgi:hypothetical protein
MDLVDWLEAEFPSLVPSFEPELSAREELVSI